jgi:DNA modification methylase
MVAMPTELTELSTAIASLEAIDWDFIGVDTGGITHGLHPYPAKFIPQIPHALIDALSNRGETVADIFCGSGTTLVESLLSGRNAVGIDANPLACLISDAKTTRLSPSDEEALQRVIKQAKFLAGHITMRAKMPLFPIAPFVSLASRPDNKAIEFWFEPFVVEELAEVRLWCAILPTTTARYVALAAFSAIIVAVSRQDSDTRYVRRIKRLAPGDVLRRFARSLADATAATLEFTRRAETTQFCTIHQADLLTSPDIGLVDLVVCSPPYPNAYSYHLYHMTRMVWLDMDQPRFRREEIGSHRKYSSKGPNGATVETFRSEMALIFEWLSRHLRIGRYACFVVGDSTIRGQRVDNASLLADIARECGFREVGRIERRMQDTKKAFNPVIGKIKSEHILVPHCARSRRGP